MRELSDSTAESRPAGRSLWRDFNASAAWAGVTAFIWYAFGAVPLQIAVADKLGLAPAPTSSWIFIVWSTGAVASVLLSLTYRQPIPITWSIPGLVYLGTLAGRFEFAEIAGANVLAGLLLIGLGLTGVGGRIMALLPLPLAMGMFAGSILGDLTRVVRVTVEDALIAGAAVAGYAIGRVIASPRLPPVGVAVVAGAVAVVVAQRMSPAPVAWAPPSVTVPEMAFSLPAFVAISVPMVVLALALGNVQGLGFLIGQGYPVSVDRVTVVVGLNSVVNALFGGHTAIVARTGTAILASREAGPLGGRYWANLIAAPLTVLIAIAATPVASLIGVLPSSYIVALGGLAILASFQDAMERTFTGGLRFGALVAFLVAATPFSLLGITSAFWGLVAGFVGSLLTERSELVAHWRQPK